MPASNAVPQRRIALIHALRESIDPIRTAFERLWPEAQTFNLLDDSLAPAVRRAGSVTPAIHERFLTLANYALGAGDGGGPMDAILFTCSAFGPAIETVQRALPLPVLKPNEAAFEAALQKGRRIGVLVSFEPSLAPLLHELETLAARRGHAIECRGICVPHALQSLQSGHAAEHDATIAAAAAELADLDVLVLGQFSMARARQYMAPALRDKVLTTPESAVTHLRRVLSSPQ